MWITHVDLVGQTDLVVPRGGELRAILQPVELAILGLEIEAGVVGVVGSGSGALAAGEPAGKAAAQQWPQSGQAGRDDANTWLDAGPDERLCHVPGQIGRLDHEGEGVHAHDARDADAAEVSRSRRKEER